MIRLSDKFSLIFFVCFFVGACKKKDKDEISIVWSNEHAAGISIPTSLLKDHQVDSALNLLHVRLQNNTSFMLGKYSKADDKILYKPLIPLSSGLTYEILFRNSIIGKIKIPLPDPGQSASLVAVYPTQDTLPENLLKVYLKFTAPMREGEALQHVSLLDEHNDTVPGVFLNLEQELWNKERTVLTLWLDPGRIKRDLIPNKQMGNPLRKGQQYNLSISNAWKDARGLPLGQSFSKKFIVAERDSSSPRPELWKLQVPAAATTQTLKVSFGEPLDYYLLQGTIGIFDNNGKRISCTIKVSDEESVLEFTPDKPWQAGHYYIQTSAYLEDLAGNNLNRPFDRDIRLKKTEADKQIFEREFVIR